MAYSFAAISAADIALLAADKPIMAGITSMSASTGKWVASTTGTWATADDTNATYPFRNAYDGLTHVQTRPTTSGTGMAMLFDFGAAGIEFDFLTVLNHTLYSDGCTACTVQIADDNAYTTNIQTIATFNPSTLLSEDRRFTRLDLYHTGSDPLRYTDVRYARVQLTFGAGAIPRVGEFGFCRRRQWKWNPNNDGWDPDAMQASVSRLTTSAGINRDTVYNYGARPLEAVWVPNSTTQHTDILNFWSDTVFGTRPFIYIDTPTASPNDAYLMSFAEAGAFSMPFSGWQARRFPLSAIEQGPYFLAVAAT